jgi:predicted aconitase with swiveling domain
MSTKLQGRVICGGQAEGQALVTHGISFSAGRPRERIIRNAPRARAAGAQVLVFLTGKGSTVGSYTLYRLRHSGAAPAAIINAECETITAVGCIIAEIPCLDQVPIEQIPDGAWVKVDGEQGTVEVSIAGKIRE